MSETKARTPTSIILLQTAAGLFLFAATAAVVWWQNSRLTVLYDVSGILENATRMAEGKVPYVDFPFPYAPLTFLMQAALIRFTGAVYWHHIAYACIVGGLGTVLTWRILVHLFANEVPRGRLIAFISSLPLIALGIYCIFPHPFYDPDATFVILIIILLTLWAEKHRFPPLPTLLIGILFVVPLFIKQNIGLALLASSGIWLIGSIAVNLWKRRPIRPAVLLLCGIAAGLGISAAVIQWWVGIGNYWHWTIEFASAKRAPSINDMVQVYQDWMLGFWVVIFLVGAFLLLRTKEGKWWKAALWIAVMAIPFLWPVIGLAIQPDPSDRAEMLTGCWPFVFIISFVLAYVFIRRRLKGVAAALPFVLIFSANGVFLSQQLWGSTYGIWPLLIILIAIVLRQLYTPDEPRLGSAVMTLAVLISACLGVAGAFYLYSNERLDYVDLDDGDLQHSTLPQLKGLAIRGTFLSDFEELVTYSDENIPRDDGILVLPGEDLFYFTTGRVPHYPILTFDYSYNPYTPEQIHDQVVASDIEWIIVKNDLQIEVDKTIDDRKAIVDTFNAEFRHVESLNNYEIYKRRHADDPKDEDNDDDSSDDNSGDDDSPDDSSD